jgi:hypothetical protein
MIYFMNFSSPDAVRVTSISSELIAVTLLGEAPGYVISPIMGLVFEGSPME